MKKIVLILAYFGTPPTYFHLWRKSAENNPTIDFLIYTDMELVDSDNVKIVKMSFDDFRHRIMNSFQFKCILSKPYKICDYRPAFGYVFQKDIKQYDYWGYVDSDVIFGDLRKFLTDELLEKYERFSNLGHLTVFRNSDEVNRKFMYTRCGMNFSYKEAFQLEQNVAFDEKGGIKWLSDIGFINAYTDYTYVADIFPDTFHFRTFYNYRSDARHIYQYENGHLYAVYTDENSTSIDIVEMMYIHLQSRRMQLNNTNDDRYLILPNQFSDIVPISAEYIIDVNEGALEDAVTLKEIPSVKMTRVFRMKKFVRRRLFMKRSFLTDKEN